MKSIFMCIALSCLPVVCFAQAVSLEIRIVPIILPKESIIAHFDGDTLTVGKVDQKATPVPLTKKNAENIRKAVLACPNELWKGYWASLEYLDGYIIVGNLEIEGKTLQFQGWNGCPPKFSAVLASLHEVSQNPYFKGWEDKEKTAKQHESFDAFQKAAIPDDKKE